MEKKKKSELKKEKEKKSNILVIQSCNKIAF